MNTEGFYYYGGSKWIKLSTDTSKFVDKSIYTEDGSLAGNRLVTQGSNTLEFRGKAANGFSVNGSNFSVNTANSRVGIGTIAPVSDLQVVGNELRVGGPASQAGTVPNPILRIQSNANVDGFGGSLLFSENVPGFGYYIRHNTSPGDLYGRDGLAIGSAQAGVYPYNPARPGIFISDNQNVGFGTATPQAMFHIDGARDNGVNAVPTAAQQTNDVVINTSGNIGVGTTAPAHKLDIRSATGGAVKIADGTQGINKVLTSDDSGIATWKAIPAQPFTDTSLYSNNGLLAGNRIVAQAANTLAFTSTATTGTSHFSVDGNTFSVDAVNNRVGIGTAAPKTVLDLGAGSGKKITLWNSPAGNDFYGLGNGANVLQFFAGAGVADDAVMTLTKNGRVGVGTTSPAAKLDVQGNIKIADGTQGINKVLTSDDSGVATWKAIPAQPFTDTSLYSNNGLLAGNRTVAQAANTLAFTSTATTGTSHFSVDGSTFSVDAVNNRVGIGTIAPQASLHAVGTVKLHTGVPVAGLVLTAMDNSGTATWKAIPADVSIYSSNGLLAGNRIVAQGANTLGFTSAATTGTSHFSVDGSTFSVDAVNNRVGIGTTAPARPLEVLSSTPGAVKITDGTQRTNRVFTSNDQRVGTWKDVAITFGVIPVDKIIYSHPANILTTKYTGIPVTLPPGYWLLNVNVGIEFAGSDTYVKGSNFIRFRFGDSPADLPNHTFSSSSTQPRLASTGFAKSEMRGVVTGSLAIANTTYSNKTYYLHVDNVSSTGGIGAFDLRFDWNETSITYQKIQL